MSQITCIARTNGECQNGGFITHLPWLTSLDSGKVKIAGGKGDNRVSWTNPADIGAFTAYVITHLSPAELSNKIFRIEGDQASLLDFAQYQGVPVEYVDAFDNELQTYVQRLINGKRPDLPSGKAPTGGDAAGLSNALWPGHFKNIKEVFGL